MKNTVRTTIQGQSWPQKVVLAVSGGLDSTSLLDAFVRYAPEVDLVVAHVNYQLRDEADGDAQFVQDFCQQLGVPFYQKLAPLTDEVGVEDRARAIRYDFFDEIATQTSASQIVLAQHQNDQVETLLLQLVRGGYAQSCGGMQAASGRYRRPFLSLTKQDLLAYAKENGLSWREDQTNQDPTYTGRNLLRQEVIPALETINPQARQHLADFADKLQADQKLILDQAESYLPALEEDFHLVPLPWLEKVLFVWLQQQQVYDVKHSQLQAFMALLMNEKKPSASIDLGAGILLEKSYQKVRLTNVQKNAKIDRKPEGLVLKLDQWQFFDHGQLLWTTKKPQKADQVLVLPEHFQGGLTLVLADKQDRIFLKSGSKTVRRLLIDKKVPAENRDRTWFLLDETKTVLAVWLGQTSWYVPANVDRPNVAKQWIVWRIEENLWITISKKFYLTSNRFMKRLFV